MSNDPKLTLEQIAEHLRKAPVFSTFTARDIAQAVPHAEERYIGAGETIFHEGASASELYLVLSGQVGLIDKGRELRTCDSGFIGEEAAAGLDNYVLEAVANETVHVLAIPRSSMNKLFTVHPTAQLAFSTSLVGHFTGFELPEILEKTTREASAAKSRGAVRRFIGWWIALILPAIVLWLTYKQYGFEWNQAVFFMVLSSTITMWMFSLVPEFIPGIFAIMSLLVMGTAPNSVVLSGFASGSFFMALSLFALGAIIADSGLTYRIVLLISRSIPARQTWYAMAMLFSGIFLTPVLPSANGRIKLVSTILIEMIESLGLRRRGKAATFISFSAFAGASLFSFVFLSSKSANFVVYGLLPTQVQHQFSWGYWLKASAVAGIVALVCFIVFAMIYFRNNEIPKTSRAQVQSQLRILGPLSAGEFIASSAVLLFLLGIATASMHKIALPWIGMGVLYVFLALGLMGKKEFQNKVDWSFLILLGSLVGLAKSMSYVEIDIWLGGKLGWMGTFMANDFKLFVIILFFTVLIVRIALPNTATVALFATILIPLAIDNGQNPWLVGVLLLSFSDAFFAPYQCSYFVLFRELAGGKGGIFAQRPFLVANLATVVIRLVAVYASFPYWRNMGLL